MPETLTMPEPAVATPAKTPPRPAYDVPKSTPPAQEIAEDRIRLRAYELYEKRNVGGVEGDADGDWYTAENELKREATTIAR